MCDTSHKQITFARSKGYRYAGKGFFIYEGLVLINGSILSVKKVNIKLLNVAVSPVKYNGSFGDTIPQ